MFTFNTWGNSYPVNQPIFTVVVIKDTKRLKKGSILKVMESKNIHFKGKWRISDCDFISKELCRII